MILKSVHIYGFGKYQDMTFHFSPGMNIIEGKNEAGKSTLLSFVKAILFGFESRRLPEARFEPIEGGKFGGSLTLEDAQGRIYWIERTNQRRSQGWVRVMMPDGTEQGEEVIPRLLQGMTSTFYMNIFAFGLTELSYLASLNQDEVSNYLYHSGTGLSQQQLKKQWTEEMDRLFKPRGNQPALNRQLNKLEELGQQIHSIQRDNESYNQILQQKEELDRKIIELQERVKNVREQQKQWEKLKEIYPIWEELQIWRDRLEHLSLIPDAPENGVSRLEELERKIRELTVELEGDLQKIEQIQQGVSSISHGPLALEWEEEISTLSVQSSRWVEKKEQHAELITQLQEHQQELNRYIDELGQAWDLEKLSELDISISQKERFREQRQLFHGLSTSLQALEEMIQTKEDEAQDLKIQCQQVQMDLDARDPITYLSQWEEHWLTYQQMSHSLEAEQKQLEWVEQQWKEESQRRQRSKAEKNLDTAIVLSFICMLVGMAGAVWLYLHNGITAWILLPVIIGIFLAVLIGRKGKNQPQGEPAGKSSNHLQGLNQKRQQLDDSVSEKKRQLAQLSAQVFRGEKDRLKIHQTLQHLRQLRESYLQLKDQWQWVTESYRQNVRELEKLKNRKAAFESRLEEERELWNKILYDFHLPFGLSPDGALEVLTLASKAKECLQKHDLLKSRISVLDKDWKDFEGSVRMLGQKVKVSTEPLDVWRILQILQRRQQEEKDDQIRRAELTRRLQELEDLMRKREGMVMKLEEERRHLFAHVQASNGEQFRKACQQSTERRYAEEKVRILLQSFHSSGGDRELEDKLSAYSLAKMDEARERCAQEVDQQTQILQELLDQRGQCRHKLEQMESGETLSILLQQQQELMAEAEEAGRKWIVLRLAQQVLEKTRESYEAQRQPGVIRDASAYFAKMTQGKYPKIFSPIGEQRLLVERGDGVRLEPGFLSRGTKEQLFLALRFALMKACEKTETLPILLDDIFVNFDEDRTLSGIRALENLAKEHQVLFFTCHSHVAKSIQAALPEAKWINLNARAAALADIKT